MLICILKLTNRQHEDKITAMKTIILLIITFAMLSGCSSKKEPDQISQRPDRMALNFKDISEIASIRRLTDLKKDMSPFFSPSGERIYFTRLITSSSADTNDTTLNVTEEYFSLDYKTNKLYLLKEVPERPATEKIPADSSMLMLTEDPLFGIQTSEAIYYCLSNKTKPGFTNIYKSANDSLVQITYGRSPSFLEAISPDEHYLVFYYGDNFERLVVFDLLTGRFYEIPKSGIKTKRYDFLPCFSPDGKRLVFLRSGELYRKGNVPFGDIWLVEFNNADLD